ncbi:hypothetical protein B6K69_03595 [Fuscovulum blasticum]|nr:hypothetical protein B6K69_03595 [Fuscovulum blasticum]
MGSGRRLTAARPAPAVPGRDQTEGVTGMINLDLPDRISVTADTPLAAALRQHPDRALRITATRLRRLEVPLVQMLLAAAADRRRRGIGLVLAGLTAAQADQLAALGVTPAMLTMERAE